MDIIYNKSFDTYPDWYKYITKKYTNLIHSKFYDYYMLHADRNHVIQIYQDSIFPFYKNNSDRFTYFAALRLPVAIKPFNILNEYGLRLSHVKLQHNKHKWILEQLIDSNQSKHVEVLDMECILKVPSPFMLRKSTSIRKIGFDTKWSNFKNLNLTAYLDAFLPTVTEFRTVCNFVKVKELPSSKSNIEYLFLCSDYLTPKLAQVISNYFAKLNTLILCGVVEDDFVINLPDNHFKNVSIHAVALDDYKLSLSVANTRSSQTEYIDQEPDQKEYNHDHRFCPTSDYTVYVNLKYTSAEKRSFRLVPKICEF